MSHCVVCLYSFHYSETPYTLISVMKTVIWSKSMHSFRHLRKPTGWHIVLWARTRLVTGKVSSISQYLDLSFPTIKHSFPITMEDGGDFLREWEGTSAIYRRMNWMPRRGKRGHSNPQLEMSDQEIISFCAENRRKRREYLVL